MDGDLQHDPSDIPMMLETMEAQDCDIVSGWRQKRVDNFLLRRLPSQMVFDHLGHPELPAGTEHPSHAILRGLLDKGRTWIKLSGAYSNSKVGPPDYPEATKVAQAFVKAAPERLVWGSDWPHPSEQNRTLPDDALLFDLLAVWAPDEATRKRILVDNPEALYGFAKSA